MVEVILFVVLVVGNSNEIYFNGVVEVVVDENLTSVENII